MADYIKGFRVMQRVKSKKSGLGAYKCVSRTYSARSAAEDVCELAKRGARACGEDPGAFFVQEAMGRDPVRQAHARKRRPSKILDRDASIAARDAGIELVREHAQDWSSRAYALLVSWCIKRRAAGLAAAPFLFEQFRDKALEEEELDAPTSPNAWGALSHRARNSGLLVGTGKFQKSASVRNHSHFYELLLIKGGRQ